MTDKVLYYYYRLILIAGFKNKSRVAIASKGVFIMSNRSYLYALNQKGELTGVAEYGYAIPLFSYLMVSVKPTPASSVIFQVDFQTAIQAPFQEGKNACLAFIDWLGAHYERITLKKSWPLLGVDQAYFRTLREKAVDYFEQLDQFGAERFHLETAELLFMEDERLMEEIFAHMLYTADQVGKELADLFKESDLKNDTVIYELLAEFFMQGYEKQPNLYYFNQHLYYGLVKK